jgi:hypothetical protein
VQLAATSAALPAAWSTADYVYKPVQGSTDRTYRILSTDNDDEGTLALQVSVANPEDPASVTTPTLKTF